MSLKQSSIVADEKGRFKPKSRLIDLTGMKFNRLTAISYVGQGSCGARWLFKCDCGKEVVTIIRLLLTWNSSENTYTRFPKD